MTDEGVNERFGRNVREHRLRRGMTQDQLSAIIGLSRASVANIEQGRQQVLLHHAWSISRAVGAPIDELVGHGLSDEPRKVVMPDFADPGHLEWALAIVSGSR